MTFAILGIVIAILLGYFITALLWPQTLSPALPIVLAPAVGLGLCSLVFVLFRRPMFGVEFGLLLLLGSAWVMLRRPSMPSLESIRGWRPPVVYLLLACAGGMVFSFWINRIERSPHGDWDGTVIWNSHARYLYRDGALWHKTIRNTFHPDYPLLTPASTARIWRYMGEEVPETAGNLGALFALSAIGILIVTLAQFRGDSRALLFAFVLIGTPFYLDHAVSGSADVPFSLYVLATIALIYVASNGPAQNRGLLVLAGFTTGCAGWTKNEGLLFIVAVSVAMLAPIFWKPADTLRRFSAFLTGLALPLIVILWFKLAVAPPSEIVTGRHYDDLLRKLENPQRYFAIWMYLSEYFWSFGDWVVTPIVLVFAYVAFSRVDRKVLLNGGWLKGVLICAIVLAGYAATYMISPYDLQWHVESSLPRLYLHLWPAFLLLAGLISASEYN
jgi:hypothetical protein